MLCTTTLLHSKIYNQTRSNSFVCCLGKNKNKPNNTPSSDIIELVEPSAVLLSSNEDLSNIVEYARSPEEEYVPTLIGVVRISIQLLKYSSGTYFGFVP